jgi:hypothetical protein
MGATVLEKCITEEQRSVLCFYGQKKINANHIQKEIFPVYGGKCFSRKAVHNWMQNVSLMTKGLKRGCRSG